MVVRKILVGLAGAAAVEREGNRVTVYRRPLGLGAPEVLFGYDEEASGIPPQLAVSTDGILVAYIIEGRILHLRDSAQVMTRCSSSPASCSLFPTKRMSGRRSGPTGA